MKKYHILLTVSFFLCICCVEKNKRPTEKTAKEIDYAKIEKPLFNSDSAFSYIKDQMDFGPRVPGSKAHALCAEYLTQTLASFADTVIVQSFAARIFNGSLKEGKNIIASFSKEKANRVLLAAHWDSRMYADNDKDKKNHKTPVPGANDGASGVGVLLEIARLLKTQQPNVGVDIIFFDLEDQGTPEGELNVLPYPEDWCIGAQYWSKNRHIPYYQAQYGILLDMVGYHEPRFLMEGTSMHYASGIMQKVWNIAKNLGYSSVFIEQQTPAIIDDHLFVNKITNIPMIDIVQNSPDGSFFPHWHTTTDDLNVINKNTLKIVGDVVLTTIFSEQ